MQCSAGKMRLNPSHLYPPDPQPPHSQAAGHVRFSPPPSKSLPHDFRRLHSPPTPPPAPAPAPAPPPPARPLPVVPGSHLSRRPDASVTEPARGRSSQDQARDLNWSSESRESRILAEYGRYPPRALSQTANDIARLEESAVRAAPLGQRFAPSFASTPAAPAKGPGRTSSMPVPKSPASARDQLTSLGVSLQNFHLGRSASLHHRKADASEPLNMHALIGNDASLYQHQQFHGHLEAGAALANDAEAMQVEALLQHVEVKAQIVLLPDCSASRLFCFCRLGDSPHSKFASLRHPIAAQSSYCAMHPDSLVAAGHSRVCKDCEQG
jgi:hypothetical protein